MEIFTLFFVVCLSAFLYSLVFTRNSAYFIQSRNKSKSAGALMVIFSLLMIPLSLLGLYIPYWQCGVTAECSYTFFGLAIVIPMIILGMIVAYYLYIRKWSKTELKSYPVPFYVLAVILVGVIVYAYCVYQTAYKPMNTFDNLISSSYLLQPSVEILPEIRYEKADPDLINGKGTYLAVPEYITGKGGEKISKYNFNDSYSNTKEQREGVSALSGAFYLERGNIDYNNDGKKEILYEVRKFGFKPPYGGDYDFEPLYALVSADKERILGVYHSPYGLPIEFYGIGDYRGDKSEGFIIGNTNTYEYKYIQFK